MQRSGGSSNQDSRSDNYIVAMWPTRLLSKKLRNQQDGKMTLWAVFMPLEDCFVHEMESGEMFIPDVTYYLPGQPGGNGKQLPCVQRAAGMFIPDGTQ